MKHLYLICICLLVGVNDVCTQSSLNSLIDQANEIIKRVETDKVVVNQSIEEVDPKLPIVKIAISEENIKKGKTENVSYTLNLALLNKAKIERKIKKTEMALVLNATLGDFILMAEDDGKSKYVDEVKLLCYDIDMLRDLEKIFQELISHASSTWESFTDESISTDQLLKSITQNVIKVDYPENVIVGQVLTSSESEKDKVTLSLDYTDGKKSEAIKYDFSLGNIDERAIHVDTKGAQIFTTLKTKDKAKKILVREEGELSFKNEVKIYFTSPSNAIKYKSLMEKAIAEFTPIYENRIDQKSNCTSCTDNLNALISNIENGEIKISGDCDTEISIIEKDKTKSYQFNWGDIMSNSVELKFNSKNQNISFYTNSKIKFIGVYEDGVLDKFDNKLKWELTELEVAEYIKNIIPNVIEQCVQHFEPTSLVAVANELNDLMINDRYEQSITKKEDKECAYIFTHADREKSKSSEYEFNLYDVDEKLLDLDISGKDISLVLSSKAKEKVFTKHDEKGKLEYTNKFEIMFDNLKSVRVGLETFKQEIKQCK